MRQGALLAVLLVPRKDRTDEPQDKKDPEQLQAGFVVDKSKCDAAQRDALGVCGDECVEARPCLLFRI